MQREFALVANPQKMKMSTRGSVHASARFDIVAILGGMTNSRLLSPSRYDAKCVLDEAAAALCSDDIDALLRAMDRSVGPPWQAKHKLAAAAALTVVG